MESYCAAHPNSPPAERRPALSIRRGLWIALLGASVEQGIVGIGFTVEGALRAFHAQYMAGQHEQISRPEQKRENGGVVGRPVVCLHCRVSRRALF
jgi:hypothetical protein